MPLIIVAHPKFETSFANRTIVDALQHSGLALEIRQLHRLYPDYRIDVKAEQAALLRHQTIVFQCPFYWLNIPALLKLWFDEVFEHQFAYGSGGDKLKDKNFVLSLTIGANEKEYKITGKHHLRIHDFCRNLEQTAYAAQMNYLDPFLCFGTSLLAGNTESDIAARAKEHTRKLVHQLAELSHY